MRARIRELETKLREAEERARTATAREDAANIYARQQDAELAQVRRAHLHELAERQKAEERVEKAEARCALEVAATEELGLQIGLETQRAENAEREMAAILDTMPADVVVRVREGAGPESVAASLAVSIAKLRGRMEKAERECGRLQKMLDVCSVVHGHNVKLKSELDEARERLRIDSVCLHGSGRHFERHGRQWSECPDVECEKDRAALGEKP